MVRTLISRVRKSQNNNDDDGDDDRKKNTNNNGDNNKIRTDNSLITTSSSERSTMKLIVVMSIAAFVLVSMMFMSKSCQAPIALASMTSFDSTAKATTTSVASNADNNNAVTTTTTKCLSIQVTDDVNNRYIPDPITQPDECLVYVEPSLYMSTLQTMLVGLPRDGRCSFSYPNCIKTRPYNPTLRYYGDDWPPSGFTMIGMARMENLRAAMEEVDRNNIDGAIVEMGNWRGGAMMYATAFQREQAQQAQQEQQNQNLVMSSSMLRWGQSSAIATTDSNSSSNKRKPRDVYLFDAFEAIPGYGGGTEFLQNSMTDVQDYFKQFGLLGDAVHVDPSNADTIRTNSTTDPTMPNVVFVKGLFKDTIGQWKPGTTPIAILRIDGNFYDSYNDALYSMYEDVPVGGIVIFDDVMSHPQVMDCWNDFKQDQPAVVETLNRIDKHSAWFRKRVDAKLDHSKKRPPRDVNLPPKA